MTDYHSRFEEISHGILLYNPSYDDTFFVTQFLGGLKEEIRAAIALHRPKTVQDASELALLQELELEAVKPNSIAKSYFKVQPKTPYAGEVIKPQQKKDEIKAPTKNTEDKFASLKSFRRANGLCFVCGEKWTSKNHQCPTHIPIYVIQELMEAVQVDSDLDYTSSEEDAEVTARQVVMAVQHNADRTFKRRRKIELLGSKDMWAVKKC